MPSIGKISGLCADYSQATFNGRSYDKVYERILKGEDFRFNEMMKRGGIPCELGHPTDLDASGNPRTETDPTKVAVILTEVKKSGPQKLVASGEITDTPNGRIFKELSNYYNFGLSSRGSYEVNDDFDVEGPDGWNQDSYIFKGYDLVLIPANTGSVLSVTEGVDDRPKITKVARESIDVNLLAKASQLSEDQVEKALDQLFGIDQEAKKDEEITVPEMKDRLEDANQEEITEVDETEVIEASDGEGEEIKPALIADGDEVEKIRVDLQNALDEVKALTEGREKDGIELANRDAEVARLTSEIEGLKNELDERIAESEKFVEQFESLKELSSKLVESYREAKEIFGSKKDEPSEDEEKLKEELEAEKEKRVSAEESCSRLSRVNRNLSRELATAKESLISYHSMALGISKQALENALGRQYSVKNIKAVAESIANQSTYSMPVIPVTKRRASSTESLMVGTDEVERELLAQIKLESRGE